MSVLACTPDLRQMLLQASRFSNEHLSLSQVRWWHACTAVAPQEPHSNSIVTSGSSLTR